VIVTPVLKNIKTAPFVMSSGMGSDVTVNGDFEGAGVCASSTNHSFCSWQFNFFGLWRSSA
jgi:hypothetical protein